MPCYQSNGITICSPTITRWEKTKELCPTCEELTDFLVYWQEWYGWTKICLACGEQWQSGERLERPFERGWREESIQYATKLLGKLEKELNEEECPVCHGAGATTDHHDPCSECGGSGKMGEE